MREGNRGRIHRGATRVERPCFAKQTEQKTSARNGYRNPNRWMSWSLEQVERFEAQIVTRRMAWSRMLYETSLVVEENGGE